MQFVCGPGALKKDIFIAGLIVALCFGGDAGARVRGGAPFLGPGTPIFFATAGNDSTGDGSFGNPFATPARAQTAARAVISGGGCANVLGMGGIYFLASTLALTSADSGTAACETAYRSYPGEVAILSGGVQVSGWVLCTDAGTPCNGGVGTNIYKATVSSPSNFREFYAGASASSLSHRTRAVGGAVPSGWSANTGTAVLTAPSTGLYSGMSSWGNPTNIEIVFRAGYYETRCKVASISGSPPTVNLSTNCTNYMINYGYPFNFVSAPTTPYFVENAAELLATCGNGCWYYDVTSHVLYYTPDPGENMASLVTVVPSLANVITGTGVSHLILDRLQISHSSWLYPDTVGGYQPYQAGFTCLYPCSFSVTTGIVSMGAAVDFETSSHDLTISHNLFAQNGGRSLMLGPGTQTAAVSANDCEDNGGGCMQVGGMDNTQSNVALQTTAIDVNNNLFNDGGPFEYRDATAYSQTYLTNSTFTHNAQLSAAASPWQFGWGGWGTPPGRYPGYTANITLANNLDDNYCQEAPFSDCGGIYTNGHGNYTVNSNYVQNSPSINGKCFYPDEGSGPQTWNTNVCDGTSAQALYIWTSSINNITFTSPWWATTSSVLDSGTSNTLASPTVTTAACSSGAVTACQAVINNAGIEAGVVPGP